MSVTMNLFAPTTLIRSSLINSNFTQLENAINNLRPQIFIPIVGNLVTGTNLTPQIPLGLAANLTMSEVILSVKTAPTGAALIVDINKNGSSIFTTRPQIAAGATSGGSSAVFASPATVTDSDVLTVDVDQIGSTVAGSDLTITLVFAI